MGNQQNSIVLNGKLYDAVTGELIHAQTPQPKASHKQAWVHKKKGLVIDGVYHSSKSHHLQAKPKSSPAKNTPSHSHTQHQSTAARAHKPQRPATLMRQAVKKPGHNNMAVETQEHLDERTAQRLARAQNVPKSRHISRFTSPHHSHASSTAHRPVPKKHAQLTVQEPPIIKEQHSHAKHHDHKQSTTTTSEQLVANALKNAHAHEAKQRPLKKVRQHKAARFVLASAAFLLLAGFFLYQNIPNLSMQVAARRAGFAATQPGYRPAGFTQDKLVSYSPGKITISFHSNTDDRAYQLTQQVSNWNSQALADNFLASKSQEYQTYQANGKTIYVFGDSNATWVNGGIWYQVSGDSSLSSDQLVKIANSI